MKTEEEEEERRVREMNDATYLITKPRFSFKFLLSGDTFVCM